MPTNQSPTPARQSTRLFTYEDLAATPPGQKVELIDGVLYVMPHAAVNHSVTTTEILFDILSKFGQRGSNEWLILGAVELHLGRPDPKTLVLIPDVVGWRRSRLAEAPKTQGIDVVPDWVCEVLSPGNERHDRGRKLRKYAGAGVPWVWLPNPRERTVEVYKLDGPTYRVCDLVSESDTAQIPPFEGAELDVRLWWLREQPLTVSEPAAISP